MELLDKMKEDMDNLEVIDEMQKEWLFSFERQIYESVFVRWNDHLRKQSIERVQTLCH